MKQIDINEFPDYSPWVLRILGIDPIEPFKKTADEVTREFNDEVWGELLLKFNNTGSLVSDVDRFSLENVETICAKDGRFYVTDSLCAQKMLLARYHIYLKEYIKDSSALIEMGAGYGSMILNLLSEKDFSQCNGGAYEYTHSGFRLLKVLAENNGIDMSLGYCDFRELDCSGDVIEDGALIYTSYSAHYVPYLSDNFVDFFNRFSPSVVVHFEPIYEFCDDSLYGLMCKRYIELNDYNRNLYSLLKKSEEDGRIEIVQIERQCIGINALLPISVIAWKPV